MIPNLSNKLKQFCIQYLSCPTFITLARFHYTIQKAKLTLNYQIDVVEKVEVELKKI